MTTLVWLFLGMSVIITAYITTKVTSWNVKKKISKQQKIKK